ncbi:MAG TPA: hypothetical protein VNN73_03510 [Blastocatellia bacterium]|nr:hypothetical protein [Blastocatellia bacterium]
MDARGETATVGAAEIRYSHVTESVFGANLTSVNVGKSLIYSAPLRGPEDAKQLEGIWWFWDSGTDGFVAVQNASPENVTVTPTLYVQERGYRLEPMQMNPHEMKWEKIGDVIAEEHFESALSRFPAAGALVKIGKPSLPALVIEYTPK